VISNLPFINARNEEACTVTFYCNWQRMSVMKLCFRLATVSMAEYIIVQYTGNIMKDAE